MFSDLMSKLAKDLFFILELTILLRSEPELLICVSVIVPQNGDKFLAKYFVMLLGEDPIAEIIGLKVYGF